MSVDVIANLRVQIGGKRDGALLRISLANALLAAGQRAEAIVELRAALVFDPNYSAAWKQLGRILADDDQTESARAAFTQGIAVADARGDRQAGKEMRVFLRRLGQ
jgi:predicted Zn-dependent protease